MINLRNYNDFNEVKNLLSECMCSDEERINAEVTKYLEDESRELYGWLLNNKLVGLIGVIYGPIGEVELKHIAVRLEYRSKGLGRQFVKEYMEAKNIVKMKAVTDKDAVGFYTRIGFTILSLGEKYPGVERFDCTFSRHK